MLLLLLLRCWWIRRLCCCRSRLVVAAVCHRPNHRILRGGKGGGKGLRAEKQSRHDAHIAAWLQYHARCKEQPITALLGSCLLSDTCLTDLN